MKEELLCRLQCLGAKLKIRTWSKIHAKLGKCFIRLNKGSFGECFRKEQAWEEREVLVKAIGQLERCGRVKQAPCIFLQRSGRNEPFALKVSCSLEFRSRRWRLHWFQKVTRRRENCDDALSQEWASTLEGACGQQRVIEATWRL